MWSNSNTQRVTFSKWTKDWTTDRLLHHFNLIEEDIHRYSGKRSGSVKCDADAANFVQEDNCGSRMVEKCYFTLRDIEDGISPFSEDDTHDVCQWMAEFEDVADTVCWNDL